MTEPEDDRERIEAAADSAMEGEVLPALESTPDPAPGSESETDRERQALAGLLASVTASMFALVATRRQEPHWNLTAAEARDVGDATATAIMHYFPWLRLGPLLAAAGAWAVVIVPRSLQTQVLAEQRAGAAAAAATASAGAADGAA